MFGKLTGTMTSSMSMSAAFGGGKKKKKRRIVRGKARFFLSVLHYVMRFEFERQSTSDESFNRFLYV